MIWVCLAVGFAVGAVAMWVYLMQAGLFRTRGEWQLAKLLGDEQMNHFCEQAAKHSTK